MTEKPSRHGLRTRYALISVLCVLAAVLALVLIDRHGPTWGIAAAIFGALAGAEGIRRTAIRLDIDLEPMAVSTPTAAEKLYFARDHQAGHLWRRLSPTTDPAGHAHVYRELAGLVEDMAVVYRLVEGDVRVAIEVQRDQNDEVRVLHAVAAAEQARADGTPRQARPWPDLERAAGDLLDRIADPAESAPGIRARCYLDLADRLISKNVLAGNGAEVLASISRCYAALPEVNA
jgi:hypothetical protein